MIPGERFSVLLRYLLLVAADLAAKVMAFAATWLVVRHFGPAGLGRLSVAASLVTAVVMMSACGLDIYGIRSVARLPAMPAALAGTIIRLRTVAGAAGYAALLAAVCLLGWLRELPGLVAVLGLSLFTSAANLSWVAEGLQKTHVQALANLGNQLLGLVLLLAVLRSSWGLWAVPAGQVLAEAAVAAALLVWVSKTAGGFKEPLNRPGWRDLLGRSSNLAWSRMMRAIALGSDLILLGVLVPMREAGWYSGAYKLFGLGMSLCVAYLTIEFPRLVGEGQHSADALRREMRFSLRLALLAALPGLLAGGCLAGSLLKAAYGPSFLAARLSLQMLLATLVVYLINGHLRYVLIVEGRERTDLMIVAVSCVVHLLAKSALIPALGIAGAALGTLAGESVLGVLAWWAVQAKSRRGGVLGCTASV